MQEAGGRSWRKGRKKPFEGGAEERDWWEELTLIKLRYVACIKGFGSISAEIQKRAIFIQVKQAQNSVTCLVGASHPTTCSSASIAETL